MRSVKQSSVFAHENGNHVMAMVSGQKLIKEYPIDWKEKNFEFKILLLVEPNLKSLNTDPSATTPVNKNDGTE